MRTYHVEARRSGSWWAIEVPEVAGTHTQAASLDEVEPMARDAFALMAEVASPDSFDVDIEIVAPGGARSG